MPGVVLVEFAAVDRFHRAISFPFVQGLLRAQGVATRWVRFGLDARARASQSEAGTDLSVQDKRALGAILDEARPSHLLFSQEPAPALIASLQATAPSLRLGFIDDSASTTIPRPHVVAVRADGTSIGRFAGVEGTTVENLFDEVIPDFGWEAANAAAAAAPSLPFLLCGEECNYRRGLKSNPFFESVDLTGCGAAAGCTFCVRPAERGRWRNDAVTLFTRQLAALMATHPSWTGQLAVRAVGEPILSNIEAIAGALRNLARIPVHVLVDGRTDAIVRYRAQLAAAVRTLSGTGHAIQFSLVGIESFCASDLVRYNKGTTWQQNLDAVSVLLALEDADPAHFGFTRWGGLSLVLYSPWTRLEELALNLAIVRRARLLSLCGKVFTARLRLYEGLPLHAVALRDGLVADRYEDALLDTARRNFYADEVPWRFQQPGVEAISRIMLRLGSPDRDASDALWGQVDRIAAALPHEDDRLAFAERLVDSAIVHPIDDPAELLRTAEHGTSRETTRDVQHDGAQARSAGTSATLLLAYELGLKPVVRLENPTQELVCVELPKLEPAPSIQRRTRHLGLDVGEELFIGRSAAEVHRAIDLTNHMEAARDDEQWKKAAAEVGVLLGYPSCCAAAFASHAPSLRESYMWLHLRARLENPGEVSPLLHPGVEQIVNYIPCSLACAPTLHNAGKLRDAIRGRMGESAWAELDARSRHPWLLFLDQQGAAVELVSAGAPEGLLRYHAGDVRGSDPLAWRAAEGDELRIDDQQILVLKRGKVHASLGGRAFVWWYRAAVQAEFWNRMLALRFAPRRTLHGTAQEDGPPPGVAALELSRFLALIARAGTTRAVSFRGFTVESAEPRREDGCRVVLARGERKVRLIVSPRRGSEHCYVTAGPLAIHHPRDEQVDSVDKDQAVRVFARYLEAALAEQARRARAKREAGQ